MNFIKKSNYLLVVLAVVVSFVLSSCHKSQQVELLQNVPKDAPFVADIHLLDLVKKGNLQKNMQSILQEFTPSNQTLFVDLSSSLDLKNLVIFVDTRQQNGVLCMITKIKDIDGYRAVLKKEGYTFLDKKDGNVTLIAEDKNVYFLNKDNQAWIILKRSLSQDYLHDHLIENPLDLVKSYTLQTKEQSFLSSKNIDSFDKGDIGLYINYSNLMQGLSRFQQLQQKFNSQNSLYKDARVFININFNKDEIVSNSEVFNSNGNPFAYSQMKPRKVNLDEVAKYFAQNSFIFGIANLNGEDLVSIIEQTIKNNNVFNQSEQQKLEDFLNPIKLIDGNIAFGVNSLDRNGVSGRLICASSNPEKMVQEITLSLKKQSLWTVEPTATGCNILMHSSIGTNILKITHDDKYVQCLFNSTGIPQNNISKNSTISKIDGGYGGVYISFKDNILSMLMSIYLKQAFTGYILINNTSANQSTFVLHLDNCNKPNILEYLIDSVTGND